MTTAAQPSSADPRPQLCAVAFGLTDRGMQREHNEDSFVVLPEHNLFVVADGMGGHQAGDVASRIATETIAEFFRSTASEDVTWPFHFDTNLSEEENRLLTGIRLANRQILSHSERARECQGMGTTVVGAMFSPAKNRVFIGHVGDSRCYRLRQGQIKLLTRDHSLVNDYITAIPNLTEEQKADLPRNVITRALGMQKDVVVDLQFDDPLPGDLYLLCSDGLNGMLSDDEILAIVSAQGTDLTAGARQLIDRSNANGGEDNITVVLLHLESLSSAAFAVPSPTPVTSAPIFFEEMTTQSAPAAVVNPMASGLDTPPMWPLPEPVAPPGATLSAPATVPPAPQPRPPPPPPPPGSSTFADDETVVSSKH